MKLITLLSILIVGLQASAQSLSSTSRGSSFNPAIGLNTLILYRNSSRDNHEDGFSLQEAELQFSSDVDAYFRAEATIGIHKEHQENGVQEEHGYSVGPEEVFLETISLPGVTLKAGKFYVQFGKYNSVHTHAQPFIYKSTVQNYMFGEESLAEIGVGLSYLAPLPWFSDLTIQVLQPTNEELFEECQHCVATVVNNKNLWDLSDSLTLEWGISGLYANNDVHGEVLKNEVVLLGTDLTFKWRPLKKSKLSSFVWSTEFIHKNQSGTKNETIGGVSSFMRYQLSQRWFAQGQYEYLGINKDKNLPDTDVYTGLLAFVPTEFSSVRLQYDEVHDDQARPEKRISMQLSFSIGAHPAHTY